MVRPPPRQPQGMNFVAALLLTYLPEPEAFGALVVLMQDRGLRRYYSTDMALLQVMEVSSGCLALGLLARGIGLQPRELVIWRTGGSVHMLTESGPFSGWDYWQARKRYRYLETLAMHA